MDTAITILPSENQDWGFWGTISAGGSDAETAWAFAFASITRATSHCGESVRDFLDSKDGRHFADEVRDQLVQHDLERAIEQTVDIWMIRKVGRRAPQELRPVRGMPYLWAAVELAEMESA